MVGLESKVRKSLIEQETDELIKIVSGNQKYKSVMSELGESLVDTIVNLMPDMDEKEKKEMIEEGKDVLSEIEAQLNNPEQLRKMMYQQAQIRYMSTRQLKAKLKIHLVKIRQYKEINSQVASQYEKAHEPLFKVTQTQDRLVRKLAKIAEREGIEKAIQKETKYAVIREMFPSREEYKAYRGMVLQAMNTFFNQAQNALIADGEVGQSAARMYRGMGKLVERAIELTDKIYGDYSEKTIKEIYG